MRNGLSYEEFIALAQEWYKWGGDGYVECWDKRTFEDYVKEFGPVTKTKAKRMFRESYYEEKERIAMMKAIW